jgi:hypothetical protein
MRSVIESCQPRDGILQGTFNPEIFTASLSEVIVHYRGRGGRRIDNLYTDAEQFFHDGTAPTEGIKFVLRGAMLRLSGDNLAPAIYRLETAFGGGKTHTLIALAHLAYRGSGLATLAAPLIEGTPLPAPGECSVAGVAGDELAVHRPQGSELVPYTLWGEIAFQIGGEALYRAIGDDATATAAPGATYFDTVFKGRKALIMLDELAQYAARLEAARPNGAEQLAAFLLSLHGYARTHDGLVVVVTLASQSDAFARQTRRIVELLSQVRGAPLGTPRRRRLRRAPPAMRRASWRAMRRRSCRCRPPSSPASWQSACLHRLIHLRLRLPPKPMPSFMRAAPPPCPMRLYSRTTATAYRPIIRSIRGFSSSSIRNSRPSRRFRERAASFACLRWSYGTSGRSGRTSP